MLLSKYIKNFELNMLIYSKLFNKKKLFHIYFKTISYQDQIKYIQNIITLVIEITNSVQLSRTPQMSD